MKSPKSPALKQKLYPAYRVLWRGWIIIVIMGVVEEAALFAHHGDGRLVFTIITVTWLPFLVYAEYSHPKPQKLGISGLPLAWAWFVTEAIVVAFNWYFQFHDQIQGGLPWLYGALAAVAIAYFVRPRPKRARRVPKKEKLSSVLWLAGTLVFVPAVGFGTIHAFHMTASSATPHSANQAVAPRPHKASPSPSLKSTPSPTTNANTGYMVVTQWGVKLPASGVLANLNYQIVNGFVLFYTSDLYPKYPLCGPSQEGLGSLARRLHGSEALNAIPAGTIDGYDYYYSGAQQPCVQGVQGGTKADEQLNVDQVNALAGEMRALKLTSSP